MTNPDERLDRLLARWHAPDPPADLADRVLEELRRDPPTDCELVQTQVHAFVADELSPQEADAIHAHVAECAPCAELTAESRRLAAVVHSWSAPEPDQDLEKKVRASLGARVRRTGPVETRWRFPGGSVQMPRLLAALLLVAACLSVANLWQGLQTEEPVNPETGSGAPALAAALIPTLRTVSVMHREPGRFDVAASFGDGFVPARGRLLRQARGGTR